MNKPDKIILHHTAVSFDKNYEQFKAVKRYHIGKGWGNIGYHYFLEPNGDLKIGRIETEDGAHCRGENHRSIGICLTGYFDIEKPTRQQEKSLLRLVKDIKSRHGNLKVYPHNFYANKSCPGLHAYYLVDLLNNPKPMYDIKPHALKALIELNSTYWNITDNEEIKKELEKINILLRKERDE